MINGKTLAVLGGLTLLAVGAAVFVETRDSGRSSSFEQQGQRLLPDLTKRLNDVAEVQVRSGQQTITITRRDNTWLIAERNNFPADAGKVRALLLGAAALTIVEPKTSNTALFAQLGLEDPAAAGAQSTLVTLKDAQGNALASVVFGKNRPGKGSLDRTEHYVRRADDQQAWLVEGGVQPDKRPQDWINKTLTNIDNQRVKQVTVEHTGSNEKLRLVKENSAATDFQVVEPKPDKPLKAPFEINNVANTFAHLSLEDVKLAAEVDFAKDPAYVAILETFDGLTLTLRTARVGEQTYGRLEAQGASPAPAEVEQTPAAGDQPAATAVASQDANNTAKANANAQAQPETPSPTESETSPPAPSKAPPVDTAKEAADFNARFANWAFELPLYQAQSIGKQLKDLLEAPPAEETIPAQE